MGLNQPGLRDGDEKDLAAALYGPGEDTELQPLSFSDSAAGAAAAGATNKKGK